MASRSAPGPDEASALGTIREVVYLGPDTRYIVSLDAGGELVVTQQNLETSSMEVLSAQGEAVRLVWKRQHVLRLGGADQIPSGESEQGDEEERRNP